MLCGKPEKGRYSVMPAGFESDIFFGGAIQTKQSTVRKDGAFVFVREGMNAQRQGYEPETYKSAGAVTLSTIAE